MDTFLEDFVEQDFVPFDDASSFTTKEKIEGFVSLPNGWHCGDGEKIESSTIANALSLLEVGVGLALFKNDAFPGLDGSVILKFYIDKDTFEFEIKKDLRVDWIHEQNDEFVDGRESISIDDSKRLIKEFCNTKWSILEYYQSITGRSTRIDSSHEPLLPSEAVSQCYPGSVSLIVEPQYAPTSAAFILGLISIHMSTWT